VHDVHDALESGALERFPGLDGAVAAAADEHHGTVVEIGARELLHLLHEMRIELPFGAVVPRDHYGAERMADEHVLHLAAAVDEERVGVRPEKCVRRLRFQVVHELNYSDSMNAPDTPFPFDAAVASAADRVEPDVVAWRRNFHGNPELGNREVRTARIVADHLRSLGFDAVQEKVAHTGVVGLLKGGT